MISSTVAVHRLLGRSCDFMLRCAVTTMEVLQPWLASGTYFTALQPIVVHALALCTSRTDLVGML